MNWHPPVVIDQSSPTGTWGTNTLLWTSVDSAGDV